MLHFCDEYRKESESCSARLAKGCAGGKKVSRMELQKRKSNILMRGNWHKIRVLAFAAAGAFAIAPAVGAAGSYELLPSGAADGDSAHFVLGVTPFSRDPLTAPGLGVGRYGVGFGASTYAWRSGLDEWEGRAAREQAVAGVFVTPAISYRATGTLALDAGVALRYRLGPSAGSQFPASLQDPLSRASGLRGADLNLGLRYALDPGTEVGLAYRSRFRDDTLSQWYPITRYSDFTTPGVQVPGVTVPQAVAATVSHQFGKRWALTGALGWQELAQSERVAWSQGGALGGGEAWFAGVGARYSLRENLGVGMAVEYLYGSGLDPARRNLVPPALPAGDSSYYFFGLDLNWRF